MSGVDVQADMPLGHQQVGNPAEPGDDRVSDRKLDPHLRKQLNPETQGYRRTGNAVAAGATTG